MSVDKVLNPMKEKETKQLLFVIKDLNILITNYFNNFFLQKPVSLFNDNYNYQSS